MSEKTNQERTEVEPSDIPSNSPSLGPDRREEIEAWWALIARILAFFLGSVILTYTVLFSQSSSLTERLTYVAIGVGLMGPVAVNGVASAIQTMRSGGMK